VVTLQASGYHALKVQGMALSRGAGRTPVAVATAVRSRTRASTLPGSSVDGRLPANAAMLAAKAPWPAAPCTRRGSPGLRLRAGDRGRTLDQAPHPRLVVHHRLSRRQASRPPGPAPVGGSPNPG
jgi:hypothetical protein